MAKRNARNEHALAERNVKRISGSRAQRRRIESDALAEARKAGTGLSIPQLKALIRRKTKEQLNK